MLKTLLAGLAIVILLPAAILAICEVELAGLVSASEVSPAEVDRVKL